MKKLLLCIAALALSVMMAAQDEWTRVEVKDLTLVGKAFDTPNPYHRIDTVRFKGFTKGENLQCRVPAGLVVLFKTDAKKIGVCAGFGERSKDSYRSYRGFDLYIKKDGKWLWAGMNDFVFDHQNPDRVIEVVKAMDGTEHECMMYLPLYAELNSCKVCVPAGASLEAIESPFHNRIVFHGSSFTHGISCTRAGMSYPMQFMRKTGLQVIPMGFSGNCKMQPYFADVMENIDADAFVFDPFSNPNIPMIRERLLPFIDRMVKAHPGKPLIFQRTIYWERENFNTDSQKEFGGRRALSDSLMAIACKKYKDVYYIKPDAALHNGESSTADGVHPNDNGYSLWEKSIEKPILKILKKYGIRK
ncbi:MAG: SGNH/GDSL hydrolase family protein [Bacteroidales bacterium]|nr:SGNH/GDSL hydrolase family protein [Bacteroidales bacterium]